MVDKLMKTSPGNIKVTLSILCGIWFALTSWLWIYWFNLIFSFPVGIIGFMLWRSVRQHDPKHKALKISILLHILGLCSAIISLIILLINN